MAKKSKKPASETLVKSILDDLQKDNEISYSPTHSKATSPSAIGRALMDKGEMTPEETRTLPEGLSPEAAYSKAGRADEDSGLREDPSAKTQEIHAVSSSSNDATVNLSDNEYSATRRLPEESGSITFKSEITDRTQPMIRPHAISNEAPSTKVSHGFSRPLTKSSASMAASVTEVQMLQAENLRMAQTRILELEKEVEQLRQENELLASAGEIAKKRAEEFIEKFHVIERMKIDALDQAQMEMNIYRENLVEKDKELARMRNKIEDLETRLAKDLKKIRVRERELENRLELAKMEKTALVRAKDDAILDLKGKVDQLHSELENYKMRCADLNQKVDGQYEQLGRTVRALRLALTHLEANDTAGNVTPLKKAE